MPVFERPKSDPRSVRRQREANDLVGRVLGVALRRRGEIRADLSANQMVVPGWALGRVVPAFRDRLVDQIGTPQNGNRYAQRQHEQRDPCSGVSPDSVAFGLHNVFRLHRRVVECQRHELLVLISGTAYIRSCTSEGSFIEPTDRSRD